MGVGAGRDQVPGLQPRHSKFQALDSIQSVPDSWLTCSGVERGRELRTQAREGLGMYARWGQKRDGRSR